MVQSLQQEPKPLKTDLPKKLNTSESKINLVVSFPSQRIVLDNYLQKSKSGQHLRATRGITQ